MRSPRFAVIDKLLRLRAEGMRITNAEIAEAMGRSESGVKSKLSRMKRVGPYRRTGVGVPGRKSKDGVVRRGRREDRIVEGKGVDPRTKSGDDGKRKAA